MNQKVNPLVAVVAGAIVVAVVGLIFYFISNRTAAPSAPIQPANLPPPIRNVAPDQQIKMRMEQMPESVKHPPAQPAQSGGTDSG